MPCDLCQPQTAGHSVLYEYFDGSHIIEMHQKGQGKVAGHGAHTEHGLFLQMGQQRHRIFDNYVSQFQNEYSILNFFYNR